MCVLLEPNRCPFILIHFSSTSRDFPRFFPLLFHLGSFSGPLVMLWLSSLVPVCIQDGVAVNFQGPSLPGTLETEVTKLCLLSPSKEEVVRFQEWCCVLHCQTRAFAIDTATGCHLSYELVAKCQAGFHLFRPCWTMEIGHGCLGALGDTFLNCDQHRISLNFQLSTILSFTGSPEPIPADIGWEAGHTLDKLPKIVFEKK